MTGVLGALVDWAALGDAALYAFVAAVAVTALFTTGVVLLEPSGGGAVTGVRKAGAGVVFALCLAVVAFGVYVMMTSK